MVQKLLNGKDLKMTPLVSLYYFAPVCASFNLAIALFVEWPHMSYDQILVVGVVPFILNGFGESERKGHWAYFFLPILSEKILVSKW